jgi:hypothetical protein
MKTLLYIILISISCSLLAQESSLIGTEIPVLYMPLGYVLESISGAGFQNCGNNHIANINSSNPASSSNFQKLSFGLSYQFESSEQPNWVADINCTREKNSYPQSIGLIVPLKSFRFGFGFSQRYNSLMDYGKMEISTIEQPDGTGKFISATKTEIVYCYSGLCSYSINNFLGAENVLSIGLASCLNDFNLREHLYNLRMSESVKGYGWTFGVQYNLADRAHFGFFYLKNPLFKDDFLFDGIAFRIDRKMPDKFNIELSYRLDSHTDIFTNFTKVYWHQLDDDLSNYTDVSGGIQTYLTNQLSLSVSFLSTGYHRNDQDLFYFNYYLNGLYVLGGLNYRFRHFDIDLAYVTSSRHSGDWRKQKIGKIALGFYL